MRPPDGVEIPAPEFPPRMDWLNVALLRMDRLMGSNVVLLEFWDFARVNSLRTQPYVSAWHERYADAGLRVIGVHSPAYSFGRDRDTVASAAERMGIGYPVLLDPDFAVWQLYGNHGWPGRYVFDKAGLLRELHYGEGAYEETERTIQECLLELDPDLELPEPLEPIRPEDAPGVVLAPQTEDIKLPAERDRLELVRDWNDGEDYIEAMDAGAAAGFEFEGGEAWAVLSGGDVEPGLYRAEGGEVVVEAPGVRLHGIQFTPEPPAPS